MIDFAALVLGPVMAVFGQPVTVTPLKSQPGAAAFEGRGIFSFKAVEIPIEGSDLFQQTNQPELGIRLADFATAPAQGDQLKRPYGIPFRSGALPDGVHTVFNVVADGQGGATLVLRKIG